MSPVPEPGPASSRWPVLAVLIGAGVVGAAHIGKVPPALPALRADLGLGLVAAGWAVSIFAAIGALCGAFAGMVADRLGHRRMALAGLVLLAAGGILGAAAASGTVLLLSRFVEGLGFVTTVVAIPALLMQAARPAERRLALSLWAVYMSVGMAPTMVAAPLVIAPLGWRGLWLAVAASTLALAWVLARATVGLGAPPPESTTLSAPEPASALRRPGPWLLSICFGAYTIQWISLMVWLPTFLVEQRSAGGLAAAALAALVVICNLPGNVLGGWLIHHRVARWRLMAAALVVMAACSQGIFSPALPDLVRYGLCLLFSGAGGVLPATVMASAPAHAPSPRQLGLVNGMLVQGSNLGTLAGPPLSAALVAATGRWESIAWLMTAAAAAGLVLAVAVGRIERRAAD